MFCTLSRRLFIAPQLNRAHQRSPSIAPKARTPNHQVTGGDRRQCPVRPHDQLTRIGQSRRSPFVRCAAAACRIAVIRDAAAVKRRYPDRRTSLHDPQLPLAPPSLRLSVTRVQPPLECLGNVTNIEICATPKTWRASAASTTKAPEEPSSFLCRKRTRLTMTTISPTSHSIRGSALRLEFNRIRNSERSTVRARRITAPR